MPTKTLTLKLDAGIVAALERWAADELVSLDARIEAVLRDALEKAGRGRTLKSPYR